MTLPAEQLALSGFAQGGASDTMAPGPLLATVVHTVTGEDGSGLAGLSDDQLMGIISAARRLESRDRVDADGRGRGVRPPRRDRPGGVSSPPTSWPASCT